MVSTFDTKIRVKAKVVKTSTSAASASTPSSDRVGEGTVTARKWLSQNVVCSFSPGGAAKMAREDFVGGVERW